MKFLAVCLTLPTVCCVAAPPTVAASAPPTILFARSASVPVGVSCDCTSYPFKPNPPCFGLCVERFADTKNTTLLSVKGLDPGVAVSLKVLAASPGGSTFDYKKLSSKAELETAAQKAVQGHEIVMVPTSVHNGF